MSLNHTRAEVTRAESDIADLGKRVSAETAKEADLIRKQAAINSSLNGKISPSQLSSKLRDLERVTKDMSRVQAAQADMQKRVSQKRSDLARYQDRLAREEAAERKKLDEEEKRRRSERDYYTRSLEAQMRTMRETEFTAFARPAPETEPDFDVFVSHASEDKDDFVRDLALGLQARGVRVWYDEFSLKWGDSLRRKIDQGLARSRFGIVVLSEAFFRKEWPQRELDGLVAMEVDGKSRILPIWHKVSKDEVRRFSPTLADKLAMNTVMSGMDEIVDQLVALVGPADDGLMQASLTPSVPEAIDPVPPQADDRIR